MKCDIHTQWNIVQLKKEGNPVIYNNMDESGGYHAKENNPVPEGHLLYDPLNEISKIDKLRGQGVERWLPRVGGKEKWSVAI